MISSLSSYTRQISSPSNATDNWDPVTPRQPLTPQPIFRSTRTGGNHEDQSAMYLSQHESREEVLPRPSGSSSSKTGDHQPAEELHHQHEHLLYDEDEVNPPQDESLLEFDEDAAEMIDELLAASDLDDSFVAEESEDHEERDEEDEGAGGGAEGGAMARQFSVLGGYRNMKLNPIDASVTVDEIYDFIRCIGEGSSGRVWAARKRILVGTSQERWSNQLVAIKEVRKLHIVQNVSVSRRLSKVSQPDFSSEYGEKWEQENEKRQGEKPPVGDESDAGEHEINWLGDADGGSGTAAGEAGPVEHGLGSSGASARSASSCSTGGESLYGGVSSDRETRPAGSSCAARPSQRPPLISSLSPRRPGQTHSVVFNDQIESLLLRDSPGPSVASTPDMSQAGTDVSLAHPMSLSQHHPPPAPNANGPEQSEQTGSLGRTASTTPVHKKSSSTNPPGTPSFPAVLSPEPGDKMSDHVCSSTDRSSRLLLPISLGADNHFANGSTPRTIPRTPPPALQTPPRASRPRSRPRGGTARRDRSSSSSSENAGAGGSPRSRACSIPVAVMSVPSKSKGAGSDDVGGRPSCAVFLSTTAARGSCDHHHERGFSRCTGSQRSLVLRGGEFSSNYSAAEDENHDTIEDFDSDFDPDFEDLLFREGCGGSFHLLDEVDEEDEQALFSGGDHQNGTTVAPSMERHGSSHSMKQIASFCSRASAIPADHSDCSGGSATTSTSAAGGGHHHHLPLGGQHQHPPSTPTIHSCSSKRASLRRQSTTMRAPGPTTTRHNNTLLSNVGVPVSELKVVRSSTSSRTLGRVSVTPRAGTSLLGGPVVANNANSGARGGPEQRKFTQREEACFTDFRDEITLLKALDHPSICKLHEVYEDASSLYLVLELCQGGELLDRIEENLIDEYTATKIISQVTQGLAYCHAMNVVHRDIKPENILFTHRSAEAIKIIDFGIGSFFRKAQEQEGPKLTNACRVGTYAYTAPEILDAEHRSLDDKVGGIRLWYTVGGGLFGGSFRVVSRTGGRFPSKQ